MPPLLQSILNPRFPQALFQSSSSNSFSLSGSENRIPLNLKNAEETLASSRSLYERRESEHTPCLATTNLPER